MAPMYRLTVDRRLTLDELETLAREHGVTFPPYNPRPDDLAPSGWTVADWDAVDWIGREHSANMVFGPRASATRRRRIGRP